VNSGAARRLLRPAVGLACLSPALANAQAPLISHNDPIAPVILGVTGLLFFAILGRYGARRFGQPSVLGEVLVGIVIGLVGGYFGLELIVVLREGPAVFDAINLWLSGVSLEVATETAVGPSAAPELLAVLQGPDGGVYMQVAHTVDVFSRYGVIFLLFLVGLKSSLQDMRSVGLEAGRVAVLGVILPFVLGFASMRLLAPEISLNTDMFVAATLGATSVGITAEVLRELGRDSSREGHIILGAAVIDDILGLVTLAVVSGVIVSGGIVIANVVSIVVLALAFLVGAVYLGPFILRQTVRLLGNLDIVEAKMFTSFVFVMVLAWLANLVGLATIVGAFTAGVILHEGYFEKLPANGGSQISIRELIMPLEVILVPIFFVLMGIQVKLESFADLSVLVTAAGLLMAAMLGKIVSGWGAGAGKNRWLIGFGMMPRGEVGLIFASIGKSLGVITDALFSAVVLMVIVTTLAAPPLIKLATRLEATDPAD
jgi:Kef-type K+ transport system membrane component KefB